MSQVPPTGVTNAYATPRKGRRTRALARAKISSTRDSELGLPPKGVGLGEDRSSNQEALLHSTAWKRLPSERRLHQPAPLPEIAARGVISTIRRSSQNDRCSA